MNSESSVSIPDDFTNIRKFTDIKGKHDKTMS